LTNRDFHFPGAWMPDGQSLVVAGNGDIELLSLADGKAQAIVQTRFREGMPDLSPDGRWLAYVSNETGRFEVYVQAFPGGAGKRLISLEGGTEPLWSRNGRKLLFLGDRSSDKKNLRTVFEVDVSTGAALTAGTPHALLDLDTTHYSGAAQTHSYDVTADASRFLFVYESFPKGPLPHALHVVQNWFTELKQRVGR
jgi:Tol biopolymer transport system component